ERAADVVLRGDVLVEGIDHFLRSGSSRHLSAAWPECLDADGLRAEGHPVGPGEVVFAPGDGAAPGRALTFRRRERDRPVLQRLAVERDLAADFHAVAAATNQGEEACSEE